MNSGYEKAKACFSVFEFSPDNLSGEWNFWTIRQKSLGEIAKGIAGSGLSDFVQDLQRDFSENHSGTHWIFQTG